MRHAMHESERQRTNALLRPLRELVMLYDTNHGAEVAAFGRCGVRVGRCSSLSPTRRPQRSSSSDYAPPLSSLFSLLTRVVLCSLPPARVLSFALSLRRWYVRGWDGRVGESVLVSVAWRVWCWCVVTVRVLLLLITHGFECVFACLACSCVCARCSLILNEPVREHRAWLVRYYISCSRETVDVSYHRYSPLLLPRQAQLIKTCRTC